MSRSKLTQIARWLIAAALLYWALSSGKIDFRVLKDLTNRPWILVVAVILTYLQLTISFLRWKLLLKSQQISIPLVDAASLGMASQFFMTLGPGTLAGDVARGVYISNHAPGKKIRGLSTVFLDRVMGLFGMIFLGALTFVMSFRHLHTLNHKFIPALMSLGYLLLALAGVIALSLLLLPVLVKLFHLADVGSKRKKILQVPLVGHLFESLNLYSDRKEYLWFGILISVGMQIVNCCILMLLAYGLYSKVLSGAEAFNTLEFIFGASLGILVVALPLAPSGIGVGQVAFSSIFAALGWPQAAGGSLVTAFQIVTVLTNLTGFFFVAKSKETAAKSD